MGRSQKFAAGIVVVVTVVVFLIITGAVQLSIRGPQNSVPEITVTNSSCVRPPGFVLIIADLSGYNDSIARGAPINPWPVIQVKQGDDVHFLICNEDPTQPHGFAIQTYFDRGLALMPGQAYKIEFKATLPGSFVIYCNIFCTVHVFMTGRLVIVG